MKFLMLWLLAVGTAAQATVPQFDLECVGYSRTLKIRGELMPSVDTIPGRVRMRIDLDKRVWCNNACTNPRPLEIKGTHIIFIPAKTTADGQFVDSGDIDRETGVLLWFATPADTKSGGGTVIISERYRCSPGAFSGIPHTAF